jgi:hypothetical protein
MGAPTSSILSEVFPQHIEHTAIYDIIVRNKILGHFMYVDDILIAYNDSTNNIYEKSIATLVSTTKTKPGNRLDNTGQPGYVEITHWTF